MSKANDVYAKYKELYKLHEKSWHTLKENEKYNDLLDWYLKTTGKKFNYDDSLEGGNDE